ncbi:YLP motif-containing protein 1 isoform X3 [Xyrichtys novacula]|uniref:YLP motif-containing protein 1 n=2 Tax=Xyrichtys novacula TaxID=13765 RepID=A0AAV1GZ50_XYRNO|nr:YLP motif-containing protein 1 isoform X3 [Xyrichtys novacula]
MYPSWGNFGGSQSQNYGGPGPRKQPGGGHAGPAAAFGGFDASAGGSLFSTLQEQHLQQMQQLQMLHQKQLQSVLHHGTSGNTYSGGQSGGFSGPSWHSESTLPVHSDSGVGAQSYFKQDDTPGSAARCPPPSQPGHQQPPPPPPRSMPKEPTTVPPPPEPASVKPPESTGAPEAKDLPKTDTPLSDEDKASHLQQQQQLWYKKHLQNLQKLKQEKAKQNQKEGPVPPPPHGKRAPPPPSEPPKGTPPPPPPKEEPPAPPPPPEEGRSENAGETSAFTDTPEVPKDPEEAARMQQLQSAAAQWQQLQQQRAGLQYQALMQQHEKLQQVLERYQQLIQQNANVQSMSAEMQLRHYEMQLQQFTPLFQDWDHSFVLWQEQFKTYPHKDQLQDYEHQWQQWQDQMNATNAHLQERVATLTAMVPFASSQFNSGMIGQYGQYPGQDMQMKQEQSTTPGMQHSPVAVGTRPQGPPTGFGPQSDSSALPPVGGPRPAGIVRPPGPRIVQQPGFNSIRGPRGSNPRFDQPQQGFDGPPRFDKPQQGFDGPPRFDKPQQGFDGPPRFDQPQQGFSGPPRFDQPQQRFDNPQRFNQPQQHLDGPPRFDQPRQRFDGPPRFDQPRQRFDGPPRFDQPRQRFDGPPRFDQPRPRFDGPPRFDQPRFGQQPRFDQPPRPSGPQPHFERPPRPQQGPQPKAEPPSKQPANTDSNTTGRTTVKPETEKEKNDLDQDKKRNAEDMTDDNLLGAEGFFVQNDPIPQTLQTKTAPEELNTINASNNSEKSKPGNNVSSVTAPSATEPNNASAAQKPLKPEGPTINSKPPNAPKPSGNQQGLQASVQMQSRPDPVRAPLGRGRGQPPVPVTPLGRGRGQKSAEELKEPNAEPLGEDMGDMSYDYEQPEENFEMQEGEEDYQWEDPSYKEYGGGESEVPPEEMWMPENYHFSAEEEYYEEPMGGPYRGRGMPPMMRGRLPRVRGGPPMGRGGPPMARGGPPMGRGGPPMGRGGPPIGRGMPPFGGGGPPMGRGGPLMDRRGPPMGRGGPPMGRGGPPMGRGGPPMGRGGPPMGRGGPPMGRGETTGVPWEDPESANYPEEGEHNWGEMRPPMRGMRPPFPPGRGRPPRGHPGFMHPGRGHPLHPPHGPMDHNLLGHGMEGDDAEMDPAMLYRDPHGHPVHPGVGRGRSRVPLPPHEMLDLMEEPPYDEGMEGELGWEPPHGRGPTMPPHEIIDSGGMRRRPMGRGMARGMWRPGPTHEEYEEDYKEGYVEDYGHGEDGYRWRPPVDYPPEEHRHEAKYYESEWDRERIHVERDYPPRKPPPEPYRDRDWPEERDRERERGPPFPYDDRDRGRGELRIREYRAEPLPPPPPEWDRSARLPPPPERGYPADYEDRVSRYEERRGESPLDRPQVVPPAAPVTNLSESSVDPAPQGTNVLALSQRQHEIILKAAQELKLIRELQEGKTASTEQPQPASADVLPELPAGLLGLEIPADVRNVLKGMTAAAQTVGAEPASWDTKPPVTNYQSSLPAASTHQVIPKTVDYGHGHEPGATVERISYGERIILRPDPLPSDRGYEKEPLGLRDPYSRDPYYDRRSDPYLERRDYSRERELYREKLPPEYERDRYERERYPLRERDERSSLGRSGYRDRERDIRERDRSDSRDREDHYGRSGYERTPYERSGLDSGPERYSHSHSPSPYVDRRSYPEERGPPAAPPLPPPPQPPPRVEKKPEIKNIDDILKPPGRSSRPERIVIIMRGLPGSGKSHVAKLIRDKEVDCGGAPPRVLVLDDYFMTEVEKVQKDPDTGKRVKNKVLEYEYEPEMEDTYRSSMLKTFKKTLDDGFFPFIILDTINDRVKHFDQFWSAAKTKGFEVYLAEITADTQTCSKRNVHGRSLKEIMKMSNNWEPSPRHMVRLDVRSLLQDAAIEEVEMEDFNPDDELKEPKKEEEEEGDLGYIPKSKWEMDTSEAKLDKLDGLGSSGKRKREDMAGIDHFLQLPDDYATRMSEPGKKRVRWADLEEQKDADRKRAIGFVVGQTDWERITDESGQLAQRALNRTKYF